MTNFFAKPIFHGQRFDGHTLPVDVLNELQAYQEVVAQLAAAIWREENPGRRKLPDYFESGCKLTIESIDREAGCVGVVLGLFLSVSSQTELPGGDVPYVDYYARGRDRLTEMAAVADGGRRPTQRPLPSKARKALSHLGASLKPDEFVLLGADPAARGGVKLRPEFGRLFAEKSRPLEDDVVVEGLFDTRSCRGQTLGIVVENHVVKCKVLNGDVSQWNQYLDHRVRVHGSGLVNDEGEVLEVTATEKVVLAEPAHLSLQLERLRRLEAGWQGPDSHPLDRRMLDRFAGVLHYLEEEESIPRPSLYATEEGDARAEWTWTPWEVSITASRLEPTFALEALNLDTDQWVEQNFTASTVGELSQQLQELLGEFDAGI